MDALTAIVLWLILAIIVAIVASSRGRSGFGFFCLSVVLSPLIGFAVALALPNLVDERRAEERRREDHEKQAETLMAATSSVSAGAAPFMVADEIAKLGDLKERGLLTADEFQEQKTRLLHYGASPAEKPPESASTLGHESLPDRSRPMGKCPNCDATIPLDSVACPKCTAQFGPHCEWRVRSLDDPAPSNLSSVR